MLYAFPNKDYVLTRKREINYNLKHQNIAMFYIIKSVFAKLSLITEIEESINEEFNV